MPADDLPELLLRDVGAWRAWLEANHRDAAGVWLVLAKKRTTEPTRLSYDEAISEAICYGWIDSQVSRRDAATYRQRFTPRRAGSPWSPSNLALAERLAAQGCMRPSGLAAVGGRRPPPGREADIAE
ncbi:MAG TPA: hypothetical protein VED59_04625 [Acidimicrobiales bacterium]|nr:hypothetical protein [Acidimicrobiales bacterium]